MTKIKIITKREQVDKLISYCKKTKYASVDFETNGEPYHFENSYPTILGVSFQPGSAYIIPLGHFDSPFLKNNEWISILKHFGKEVIENPEIVKIAQNMKFEDCWFKKYGINFNGRCFDTMLAKYLLDEERPHDLKSMVVKWLPEYGGYEEYEGSTLPWDKKPLDGLSKYCGIDCDTTFRLMLFFEQKLIKGGFYPLFRNMLMMGSRTLAEAEFRGFDIDVPYLKNLVETYGVKIENLEKDLKSHKRIKKYQRSRVDRLKIKLINEVKNEITEIKEDIESVKTKLSLGEFEKYEKRKLKAISDRENKISRYIAGEFTTNKEKAILEPVNFSSPNQMIELLFTDESGFQFEVVKYTEDKKTRTYTDRPSTDEEVLETLKNKDKSGFIGQLLEYRGITKLYSTYIVGMHDKLGTDGRIHGSFLLHGTVTGRLSSREPNMQNIPRDTTASDIKKMFISPKRQIILQLDYSQAELRVMAAQANETAMLEWFRTGKDIHMASACKKNKWDYDERAKILEDESHPLHKETKTARKHAKTINFGIIYGQGAKHLSSTLSDPEKGEIVTEEEAKQFLEDFNRDFPRVAKFIKKQHEFAKRNGFVRNLFGRKRRLPNIDSDEKGKVAEALRQSVNAPIQGAASDYALFSSILIRDAIRSGELPKNMIEIATVHDSIIFYVDPKDVHDVVPKLYSICKNPQTKKWFDFQIDSVEMQVDFELGVNWGELKKYDSKFDYTQLIK